MITTINKWKMHINENNEQSSFEILIKDDTKRITKDNFEKGEDPNTTQYSDCGINGKIFDSIEAICEYLSLDFNKEKWQVMDDRIFYNRLEDDEANEITSEDSLYSDFKNGKIDLWAAEYDFKIAIIKEQILEGEELSKLLGIKNYD